MDNGTVIYLPRSFWTDVEPGGHSLPHEQINDMIVHHTVMLMQDYDHDGYLQGDLDDIKRYMIRLSEVRPDLYWEGRPEVPYSFVHFLGQDERHGIVVEGRGWDRTGAHTANFNSKVYGCAFAGDSTFQAPTIGLLATFRFIGGLLPRPLEAGRVRGHRDTKATACPGELLYAALPSLQPPFVIETMADQKESDVVKLDFVKRKNEDPRCYLRIRAGGDGPEYKQRIYGGWGTLVRMADLAGIPAEVVELEPEQVNGLRDLVDDDPSLS